LLVVVEDIDFEVVVVIELRLKLVALENLLLEEVYVLVVGTGLCAMPLSDIDTAIFGSTAESTPIDRADAISSSELRLVSIISY